SFGRTLTHFHSFYDEGKALSSLARHNTAPQLWISPVDANARQLADGDAIKISGDVSSAPASAARSCVALSVILRAPRTTLCDDFLSPWASALPTLPVPTIAIFI